MLDLMPIATLVTSRQSLDQDKMGLYSRQRSD